MDSCYRGRYCCWLVSLRLLWLGWNLLNRETKELHAEKAQQQSYGFIKGVWEELVFNASLSKKSLMCDGVLLVVCAVLFYLNSYVVQGYLKEAYTNSFVTYVAQCYFNDFLGGLAFMCYTNLLIGLVKLEMRFKTLKATVIFMLICGIFWEYVAPLFVENSVSDPLDIVAYVSGAVVYWVFLLLIAR